MQECNEHAKLKAKKYIKREIYKHECPQKIKAHVNYCNKLCSEASTGGWGKQFHEVRREISGGFQHEN